MVKNQVGRWAMGFYIITLLKFFVPSHITHRKSVEITKVYFSHILLGIMVIFLKIMKNYTNFYIFSSVYIVNSNFELDFLGSARRCVQAIFSGYTTTHLKLKSEGPVSIAKYSNPFLAL